ncbi:MAG: hypothetical protein L0Y58_17870 [Verrucomicrobia subdivision 3 bacterium]|nr:hypothetical protein [Limisphaerales bacterium]
MNSILLSVSTHWRWTRAFALLLPVCLLATGCACFHKVERARQSAPQVTVLDDSFDALKKEFNADTSKPRVLALFSPTCGGCIYGAKALQHEARKLPEIVGRAEVMIVWVAMLDSDNEHEARMAARRFDFPGVAIFMTVKGESAGG